MGSNNASTERENQTILQAAQQVADCMDILADYYPAAKLWVSAILPRLDKDHIRGTEINQKVKEHCEAQF